VDEKTLTIDGMSCGHCVARVKKALEGVPNLSVVTVDVGRAKVTTVPAGLESAIEAAIRALDEAGYTASVEK